jgi:uncharacterized membrane protein YtjA (UPF0391 family)
MPRRATDYGRPVPVPASRMPGIGFSSQRRVNMLSWAVTFLIIALIAGVLGLSGVAGTATSIAYVLFVVFLIVAAASFLMGRRPPVT